MAFFDLSLSQLKTCLPARTGLTLKTQDYVKRRTEIDYATYVRFRGKLQMK